MFSGVLEINGIVCVPSEGRRINTLDRRMISFCIKILWGKKFATVWSFILKFCILNIFILYYLGLWPLNFCPERAKCLYSSSHTFLTLKILEVLFSAVQSSWECRARRAWARERVSLQSVPSFPCCRPTGSLGCLVLTGPQLPGFVLSRQCTPSLHSQGCCLVYDLLPLTWTISVDFLPDCF